MSKSLSIAHDIDQIRFGVLSAEEIIRMSVVEVNSTKLDEGEDGDINYTADGTPMAGVYDDRMGCRLDRTNKCVTCGLKAEECAGHFGHIVLNEPVIHPQFFRDVLAFLQCFCECGKLIVNREYLTLHGLLARKGKRRFKAILTKLGKVDVCIECGAPQPKISFIQTDGTYTKAYEYKKSKVVVPMDVGEIKDIFDFVSDEDVELLGFDPTLIHPKNMIITVFPVIPPCARPFVFVVSDGNTCDDDLTIQLLEIIKANNNLHPHSECDEAKKQKAYSSLKFRISTYYDNSAGKAKHSTNNRAIKGLKERLTGKDGQVRSNLMGKRVEFAARTVITPDPTLKTMELGVPNYVCEILTFPVTVNSHNFEQLKNIVENGQANYVRRTTNQGVKKFPLKYAMFKQSTQLLYGDIVLRKIQKGDTEKWIELPVTNSNVTLKCGDRIVRDGKELKQADIRFPERKPFCIELGDIVDRHLIDGDVVLFNRQPTLHEGSMQAFKIRRHNFKTFRVNLSVTKWFNADFDGDEMNIHVPQSYEAVAELLELSTPMSNIISGQSSKPGLAIVQDSLLGVYKMTKGWNIVSKEHFYKIAEVGSIDGRSMFDVKRVAHIRRVLKSKGIDPKNVYSGRGLFSLMLPHDLIYENDNGKMAKENETSVKIYRGVMYEGVIDKNIVGASHNALTQILFKEYSREKSIELIDNIQFVTRQWLLLKGFSIGLEDCIMSSNRGDDGLSEKDKIMGAIGKCYIEAKAVESSTHNPSIREVRIGGAMGKARDVGLRIAKEALRDNNNFLDTVYSGSKGDFFNIAQITGLLGQQNLRGERIKRTMNNGVRTLPHYPFDEAKMGDVDKYESRGFVSHSFIEGLNPKEFFNHCRAGREGITDTATGTASSGYIQRRLVKLMEDSQVQYDGSVRDASGKIYQTSYGENGLDTHKLVKTSAGLSVCNVARLVDRLNLGVEMSEEMSEEPEMLSSGLVV